MVDNIVKMLIFYKLFYRFKTITIKISEALAGVGVKGWVAVNKLISKFIQKCRVPRIIETTLKKKFGELTLPYSTFILELQ